MLQVAWLLRAAKATLVLETTCMSACRGADSLMRVGMWRHEEALGRQNPGPTLGLT